MKLSVVWRRILIALLVLPLLVVLISAAAFWQLPRIAERYGIYDLNWNLQASNSRELVFEQLSFRLEQDAFSAQFAFEELSLVWRWPGWLPNPDRLHLTVAYAQIIPVADRTTSSEASAFELPTVWHLPEWLPQAIQVEHWRWQLPCAKAGGCELTSRFSLQRSGQRVSGEIILSNTPEPVEIDLTLDTVTGLPDLQVELSSESFINLGLLTQLTSDDAHPVEQWTGSLGITAIAPDERWLAFLNEWISVAQWPSLEEFTNPVSLSLAWNTDWQQLFSEVSSDETLAGYHRFLHQISSRLDGNVALSAAFLSAVPIPSLGDASGQARLAVAASGGSLQHYELALDSRIDALILPDAVAALDVGWESLTVKASSPVQDKPASLTALPLQLELTVAGKVSSSMAADIIFTDDLKSVVVQDGRLLLNAKQWQPLPEWRTTDVKLDVHFQGEWRQDNLHFSLLSPMMLGANVEGAALELEQAKVTLQKLEIEGNPLEWQHLRGVLEGEASADAIRQDFIHAHPWHWQGKLIANDDSTAALTAPQARVEGTLVFHNRLTLEHKALLQESGWQLDGVVPDIFLLAGNPFETLTPKWPPLLTLAAGRTGGEGHFSGSWEAPEKLQGELAWKLSDLSGIYDTTAFKGISGLVNLSLGEQWMARTEKMAIGEVIQGFTFGPGTLSAAYRASPDQLAGGELTLTGLEAALLNGLVRVIPATVNFSAPRQRLDIELLAVDLGRLLAEHPSSDLTGSGKISGQIPLELTPTGFAVLEGHLAAQAPGGQLQYRSARVAELAKTSGGMKVITDALDDFHYTVLNSGVSYDESGKLMLAVRLEGSNPAVESGRPINFNITLEEDLPAMIASLQLSNQLGDEIKKRVQQRIQRRASP